MVLAGACFGERERPAPPVLELLPDQATVRSPGQITGIVRVRDPDGIDSVWFALERAEEGADGLLEPRFEARFTRNVPQGYRPGDPVELRLRARDVAGFSDTLWDSVTVIP